MNLQNIRSYPDMDGIKLRATRLSLEERRFVASMMNVFNSPTRVQEEFWKHFKKDPPSRLTVYRINRKFVKTGSINNNIEGVSGRKRTTRIPAVINKVQKELVRTPRLSTRRLALQFGISQTSAC